MHLIKINSKFRVIKKKYANVMSSKSWLLHYEVSSSNMVMYENFYSLVQILKSYHRVSIYFETN